MHLITSVEFIDQNIKVNIIGLDFDLEGHVV